MQEKFPQVNPQHKFNLYRASHENLLHVFVIARVFSLEIQVLFKIRADVYFLGVSSLGVNQGLTEMGYEVSIIKKEMINASEKVIVLATSDKINGKMPHQVYGLDKIDNVGYRDKPKKFQNKKFCRVWGKSVLI